MAIGCSRLYFVASCGNQLPDSAFGRGREESLSDKQPISTAPQDGTKVTVYWTDVDGQENESIAQYRSPERLKAAGGDWDRSDGGWWIYTDSDTQKRVNPHSWSGKPDADEE